MPNNSEYTEIRNEEVQEILTKIPHWLIRYGISIIFILIIVVLFISWFVKYPDTVVGKALISTELPPLYVSSKVSGRIVSVYVENGQFVKEGDPLVLIDNPVPESSIKYLKSFLDSVEIVIESESGYCSIAKSIELDLYEAKADFLGLKNTLKELCTVQNDTYTIQKLQSLKTKHSNYLKYQVVNTRQIKLSQLDLVNAKERFQMLEKEFNMGVSSRLDFLNARSAYNQRLKNEEGLKKNEIQLTMTLNDYQDQIRDFVNAQAQKEKADKHKLREFLERLKNHVIRWNNEFLIKSPVDGHIGFLDRLFENQQVEPGVALIATMSKTDEYEVILDLPIQGFGKIKVGQEVKIKVDNFPAQEFGLINGVISALPSLPKDDIYRVEVTLPKGLMTSYNQELVYQPEMTATAEVITEDLRLIERFFYQLRIIMN